MTTHIYFRKVIWMLNFVISFPYIRMIHDFITSYKNYQTALEPYATFIHKILVISRNGLKLEVHIIECRNTHGSDDITTPFVPHYYLILGAYLCLVLLKLQ